MGVLTLPNIPTLGRTWTHRQAVSEAMVLTNTVDNERIQMSNVRAHLNVAISTVVEQLALHNDPFYGVIYKSGIEATYHDTGLHYIDLGIAIPTTTYIPIQNISKVERVSAQDTAGTYTDAFIGNFSKKDISEIVQLENNLNVQHRDSVYWCHYGNIILLFIGFNINTSLRNNNDLAYRLPDDQLTIFAMRQPTLDDLKPIAPDINNVDPVRHSQTFDNVIDLPDRYVKLAIALTQKFILEQLEKTIPQQLEQELGQSFMKANNDVQNELQIERARRQKEEYGEQNK